MTMMMMKMMIKKSTPSIITKGINYIYIYIQEIFVLHVSTAVGQCLVTQY